MHTSSFFLFFPFKDFPDHFLCTFRFSPNGPSFLTSSYALLTDNLCRVLSRTALRVGLVGFLFFQRVRLTLPPPPLFLFNSFPPYSSPNVDVAASFPRPFRLWALEPGAGAFFATRRARVPPLLY